MPTLLRQRAIRVTFAILLLLAAGAFAGRPKVLIIGIDGLRSDAFFSVSAPVLQGLIPMGAFSPDALADRVTRSGPGWTAILTGSWSPRHGVVDNTFAGYRGATHPTLFQRLKDARPELVLASVVAWSPLQEHLLSHGDIALYFRNDASVAREAVRLLSGEGAIRSPSGGLGPAGWAGPADADPDLLFVHFDAPDFAGHRWGFSRFSPPYRGAIMRTDVLAGKVLAALEARPQRAQEDWLILCVTDHGGTLRHHGDDIPACRRVPLIAVGDGMRAGAVLQDAAITDVMPTVLAWLGVEAKEDWALEGAALIGPPVVGGPPDATAERAGRAWRDQGPAGPGLGRRVSGDRLSRQATDLLEEEDR